MIGIAGGEEKCRWLVEEFGWMSRSTTRPRMSAAPCARPRPTASTSTSTTSAAVLDAVLTRLARGARIVICGAVSQYNGSDGVRGPANYMSLLVARAAMIGFVVFDYAARYGEAAAEIAGWMREGRLISREDVIDGGVRAFPTRCSSCSPARTWGSWFSRSSRPEGVSHPSAGTCWVMQWMLPPPSRISRAGTPTTSRSGKQPRRTSAACSS